MELNINEFEQDDDAFLEEYLQEYGEEEIPENIFVEKEPIIQRNQGNQNNLNQGKQGKQGNQGKQGKQGKQVQFEEHIKPMHQSIPKQYAKMTRPKVTVEQPKVSYDDILLKMGMFVADGKLHLGKNQNLDQDQGQDQGQNQVPDNSYIYNKYFNNDLSKPEPTVNLPHL